MSPMSLGVALPEFRHTERDKVADGGEDKDTAGFGEKEIVTLCPLKTARYSRGVVGGAHWRCYFRNA